MAMRHGLLRPCRAPVRRCVPRVGALRLHTLCRGASGEYQWLAANQLPGTSGAATAGGRAGSAAGKEPQYAARRFHYSEAPAVAARLLKLYGDQQWSLEAPGLLVDGRSTSGSSGRPAAAKLLLPRILAGEYGPLFASHELREPSPLKPGLDLEQQQLLHALECLAQSDSVSVGRQLVVLLSADSAALAIYAEGQMERHKVLTGYTVRRQQGKAQATYERQGGGAHSVGGSIRARETRRLFQAAASTLSQWQPDIACCNLLLRSGSVRVWNELYASNSPPPPVDRRDPRWQAVGLGVRRPRLADVERTLAALSHGTLYELVEGPC